MSPVTPANRIWFSEERIILAWNKPVLYDVRRFQATRATAMIKTIEGDTTAPTVTTIGNAASRVVLDGGDMTGRSFQ